MSVGPVEAAANPPVLSAFGFFKDGSHEPSASLLPYNLRTPLFSDYAEKQRFMHLPAGATIKVDGSGKLEFPVGTALIKSFGYPSPAGRLKIIETRVLLHRNEGWVALPYVWRGDGSDADLRVGGTRMAVQLERADRQVLDISYAVPNKNQCKQCHSSNNSVMPIGPVWQNMEFPRAGDKVAFIQRLRFERAPLPQEAKWDDVNSGTIDERARAYLRVNCGHCHAPTGSASNSGLIFDGSAGAPTAFGIGKRPVAAGRASGNMEFIIQPGQSARSILVYRMQSTDPGIAMPELGRSSVHEEGAELLRNWIDEMPSQGH
ncbi:MAG: SO2930 family diheme c-type cytochrome [Sphingorhabdus sp.]